MALKDIAEAAGVAPSTVSRVLNGYKGNFSVKPEIREKILRLVSSEGYKPNAIYQAMRQKHNRHIAVMMPSWLNNPGREAENIVEFFSKKGYNLQFVLRHLEFAPSFGLPDWKVAGVIPLDVRVVSSIRQLDESGIPYVVMNGVCGGNGKSVRFDDADGMRQALQYLYDLGHRNIAYISVYRSPQEGPFIAFENHHYSVFERAQAYVAFCQECGLPVSEFAMRSDVPYETAIDSALKSGATAIITYSMHLRVSHYLHEKGLRVPEDISLVSFNDDLDKKYYDVPATVVDIPMAQMWRVTAERLVKFMKKQPDSQPQVVRIPEKLIVRESACPVREMK